MNDKDRMANSIAKSKAKKNVARMPMPAPDKPVLGKSIVGDNKKSNLPAPRFEKPQKKNLPYGTGSKATDAPRGTGYAANPPRFKKNPGR